MTAHSSIGARLKSERGRLLLNQSEVAKIGGVAKNAQGNYESGLRSPKADYLAAIANAGFDVLFIVTGKRTPGA